MQQHSGVLVEDNMNELLLFSPDQVGFKSDRAFYPSSRTPRNLYRKILGTLSEQASASESSSGNPCIVVGSPIVCGKNSESNLVAATSVQAIPSSAPSDNMVDNTENGAGIENSGM